MFENAKYIEKERAPRDIKGGCLTSTSSRDKHKTSLFSFHRKLMRIALWISLCLGGYIIVNADVARCFLFYKQSRSSVIHRPHCRIKTKTSREKRNQEIRSSQGMEEEEEEEEEEGWAGPQKNLDRSVSASEVSLRQRRTSVGIRRSQRGKVVPRTRRLKY